MAKAPSSNEIRKTFIDYFAKRGHTVVPSSSLVPGEDATLLFVNSGMVQFKDVFLGTDRRPYTRAVDSQKCLRVAGKHNDLEAVGTNDKSHTFFEMLGNWSFGDYYKKEAIEWAWDLVTNVWKIPKERLYASVFRDELGEIPTDDEAVEAWKSQPGFDPGHIAYAGRKDNFWEMADTGPCGPNSEIQYDRGPEYGKIAYRPDGEIELEWPRFVELWNLVFIQYNRTGPNTLEPLPAKHVDTGMGFERIVSILQGQTSNYRTDLFMPLIKAVQKLAGHSDKQVDEQFTPYRVVADHARASAFLIADGVVPGNLGRNYVTRMIIRRAARFGAKLGLDEPFLAKIADVVIENYGEAYPELVKNRAAILDNITREEERFQRTVESGIANLEAQFKELEKTKKKTLDGKQAFELYATYGLPLEITRDVAKERGLNVDEEGFQLAMEEHRVASGAGQAMGEMGGESAQTYSDVMKELQKSKKLGADGVSYDPYSQLEVQGAILSLVRDGEAVSEAKQGDKVEVVLPETCFYVASGGQISDTGRIFSKNSTGWEIRVQDTYRPAAGVIAHSGEVVKGKPKVGDEAVAEVDAQRRRDIMRNHTATHLLHAELHRVLGEHARQAGSLVAPDRLRFDFTHSEPLTAEQIAEIERGVNARIFENHTLNIEFKSLDQAKAEGAIALFGEKYGETVRTIQIGDGKPFSYELCGGTHVRQTGDIGIFLIVSEGSAAAGIRRIEAVTGRGAFELVRERFGALQNIADLLKTSPAQAYGRVQFLTNELSETQKQVSKLSGDMAASAFQAQLENVPMVAGVPLLTAILPGANMDTLRQLADRFKQKHPSGVVVLAGVEDGKPSLIAAVTNDLVKRGLHAGELVKMAAAPIGGSGGGRPDMAQAGGKDASKLDEALANVPAWVEEKLKSKK